MFRYIFPLLLVFMVGCSPKKADVDFEPTFKTISLATFAVLDGNSGDYDSLVEERIKESIINEMKIKGYKNTLKDAADFYVIFKNSIIEDVPSNSSFGFGLGTFSSGSGLSVGTVNRSLSDKSAMKINMIDPKTKKVFWSTSLTHDIHKFKSPQESVEFFNKTVATMLKEFPVASVKSD